ncbi:IS1595 family transposase [Sphingopyxis witflariensis]|uniref:IS1595 family transposase n=2 Tax=Sphingopyxis witflariensis TaxID=173675 RepID=A0A246K426_9SPHN|nr:IS1595 family transposase [Sphingopyxis witflariensis]
MRDIYRMTEDDAYEMFKSIKWPDGIPTCPECGCKESWTLVENRKWKCKGAIKNEITGETSKCYLQYTVTSRTPLASRKRSFCDILAAIATFVSGVLGTAALRLKREFKNSYKTPFVFGHKIRESMKIDYDQTLEGVVEIDGLFVGSKKMKPPFPITNEADLEKFYDIYRKKTTSLVVVRERPSADGTETGRIRVTHRKNEAAAVGFIKSVLKPGTIVHADYGSQWERLNLHFPMMRVNHSKTYVQDGACTNWAESFFSRVRAAERGVYRYWWERYAEQYGVELAWREENRFVDNGQQIRMLVECLMRSGRSTFAGYWQRHKSKFPF